MKIAALSFIVLALWLIGLLTIISNPKSRSNQWLGIMALAPGFGVFGVLVSFFVPGIIFKTISPFTTNFLYMLALYITPYSTLMFGIAYSGIMKNQYKLIVILLFIPIFVMMMNTALSHSFKPSLILLSIWAIPYIVAANVLVIYAYFREKIKRLRNQKLLTCIFFIPATLLIELFNILNLPYRDIWKFNTSAVISAFILFIFLSIRYGVMGVKVKLEREQLAGTIRSVNSGTLILNHAIKNEIAKMAICMENIKNTSQQPIPSITSINENTQFVQESLQYLSLMVKKIQTQVEEIKIIKEPIHPAVIAAKALQILALPLRENNIRVINEIDPRTQIVADSFHLQEILINVIKNAIEATGHGGTLYLWVLEEKRSTTLVIQDNGVGITKENLPHVLEPFFTTKSRQQNFGLGLTYCYNVLQKHGGILEIESNENSGTTVLLTFPKARFRLSQNSQTRSIHE